MMQRKSGSAAAAAPDVSAAWQRFSAAYKQAQEKKQR